MPSRLTPLKPVAVSARSSVRPSDAAVACASVMRGDPRGVKQSSAPRDKTRAEAPSDDDEGCAATSGASSAAHPAPTVATEAEGLRFHLSTVWTASLHSCSCEQAEGLRLHLSSSGATGHPLPSLPLS